MEADPTQRAPLRTHLKRSAFQAYVLVLLALASHAWWQPAWEWDVLGYVGSVEEQRGASPEAIHATVYSELARVAPAQDAERLRGGIAYRQQLTDNAAAFNAQLPFYRGRVFYIGLLLGLDKLGLAPIRAAFQVSVLAGLCFGILLGLWLMHYLPPSIAVLVSLFAVRFGGVTDVMAMGTPDMLAAALLLAGAYTLIETRARAASLILFVLAIATRADHILLVAPLLVYAACPTGGLSRISQAQLASALAVCLALVWFCTAGRETYAWWTVFHHTFVQYKALPASQTPDLDLAFAAGRSLRSLPMFKAPLPLVFSLIAAAAVYFGWRKRRTESRGAWLGAVSLASVLTHFALFPALWPRLLLAYWAIGLVALCIACSERATSPAPTESA